MKRDSETSRLGLSSAGRRQFLGAAGAGVLATSLPGCGGADWAAPSYRQTIEWGRRAISQVMGEQPDAAAVSVALLDSYGIAWQEAFGKASVANNKAATIRTRFNIGSVSKVLAGLAAVILQERGVLDLDKPIVSYLPDFRMLSPEYDRITSRHLLTHSSGLPGTNGRNLFTFAPIPGYAADTERELSNAHLKHEPGQLAVYCNDGFTLFEQVVLAVSGQEYADFVEEHILAPLQMVNSGYLRSANPRGEFAHPRYLGKEYPLEFTNAFATGGLSSTPSDMMRLAGMFLGGGEYEGVRIVSAAGIAAMAKDQTAGLSINPSPEWRWGLGWDSVRQDGLAQANVMAWEKNGGTTFFSTEFFVLPEAGLALMITGNSAYGGKALEIAEGILIRALQEGGYIRSAPPTISKVVPPVASPPSVANAAGIYGNYKTPIQVLFGPDGSLMLNEWGGQDWRPMHPGASVYRYRSDGWWWSDNGELPNFRFAEVSGVDQAGKAYRYRYLMQRVTRGVGFEWTTLPIGQQLQPRPALSPEWQARMKSRWVLANESPDSVIWVTTENPEVSIDSLPELPGYILYGGGDMAYELLTPLSSDRAGPSVKVPVNHGRDLSEINISSGGRGEIMRVGGMIFASVS